LGLSALCAAADPNVQQPPPANVETNSRLVINTHVTLFGSFGAKGAARRGRDKWAADAL